MKETIALVGLDVHKKSISVAVADGGVRKEARYFGKIANSAQALSKLAAKPSRKLALLFVSILKTLLSDPAIFITCPRLPGPKSQSLSRFSGRIKVGWVIRVDRSVRR